MRTITVVFVIGAISTSSLAQIEKRLEYRYKNATIGFRYTPPLGMHDKTERSRAEVNSRALELHSTNTLGLLLAMSSGADDRSPTWSSITIEEYPRQALRGLTDSDARVKMSEWVAHIQGEHSPPRLVELSDQTFAVFVFGTQVQEIRKGIVVWTTIRRDQLLSFVFVANSPERLKALAETMKTVQFY